MFRSKSYSCNLLKRLNIVKLTICNKRNFVKKINNKNSTPKEALEESLKYIENKYGKGSLFKMNSDFRNKNIQTISTGSIKLNQALGIGGLPLGRIVEIFGPESSGKTTLSLSILAQAQKQKKSVCFIDAEHALDFAYASRIGLNLDDVLLSQPSSGEEALDITESLIRAGVNVIVIDSVAALIPKAEIDGSIGEHHIALQARLMSQACRKITSSMKNRNSLIIFINQIRQKIGVIFGSSEITTGGMALKFYSSVRLEIRRMAMIKDSKGKIFGTTVKVKVAKNKLASPFKTAIFDLDFENGISTEGELIDLAVEKDIIKKNGNWYLYKERNFAQGKENAKKYLKEHIDIANELEKGIYSKD